MYLNELEQYLITEKHYEDELYKNVICKDISLELNALQIPLVPVKCPETKSPMKKITPANRKKAGGRPKTVNINNIVSIGKPVGDNERMRRVRVPFSNGEINGFNVYTTVTRLCNLACNNCPSFSFYEKSSMDVPNMDLFELECGLTKLKDFIVIKALHVVGGDILLLGMDYVEELLIMLRKVLDPKTSIILHLPTIHIGENMQRYYELFLKYNIKIVGIVRGDEITIKADINLFSIYFDQFINLDDPSKNTPGIQYIIKKYNNNPCGSDKKSDKTCRRLFLYGGSLYLCSRQANADLLNCRYTDKPEKYVNRLNIFDKNLTSEKIRNFYLQEENIFCKNCTKLTRKTNCLKEKFIQ